MQSERVLFVSSEEIKNLVKGVQNLLYTHEKYFLIYIFCIIFYIHSIIF